MRVTPLSGHIFVEKVAPPEVQRSGIILPDTAEGAQRWGGVVVAVAEFYRAAKGQERPMTCEPGDYVLFKPRTADIFAVGDRTFYLVHEDNVLARMDEATFQQLTPKTA